MDTKVCSSCEEALPLDSFHNKTDSRDGKQNYCKACRKILNSERPVHYNIPYAEKWNAKTYDINWHPKVLPKMLFEFQEGRCYICGVYPDGRNLHRDHNHLTGWLRGYLCGNCNRMLPSEYCDESLDKAKEYLTGKGYREEMLKLLVDYLEYPPYWQLLATLNIDVPNVSYEEFVGQKSLFPKIPEKIIATF